MDQKVADQVKVPLITDVKCKGTHEVKIDCKKRKRIRSTWVFQQLQKFAIIKHVKYLCIKMTWRTEIYLSSLVLIYCARRVSDFRLRNL